METPPLDVVGLDCKKEGDKIVCEIVPEEGERRSAKVDSVELDGYLTSGGGLPSKEKYDEPISCKVEKGEDSVVKLVCKK